MKNVLKGLGLLLATLVLLSACQGNSNTAEEIQENAETKPNNTSQVNTQDVVIPEKDISVYIIGDSTASPYDEEFAPRAGWGQVFQPFFAEQVTVYNKARSGRSSMSYLNEGHFDKFVDEMNEGDILLIQFGHNDQKSEDLSRYTEPFTTYKEHLTTYIDAAIERRVIPVLLTPVNRNKFNEQGTLIPTHGNYPQAMRELAEEKNVALIDVTEKSKLLFETLGPEKVKEQIFLHLPPGESPNYPDGVADDTHFKQSGAIEIAKLVLEGLEEQNITLAQYIKPEYRSQ